MSKYRPEKIEMNLPSSYADKLGGILQEELAKNARLKRVDKDGKTTFSFYPTKGEYFIINVKLMLIAGDDRKAAGDSGKQ